MADFKNLCTKEADKKRMLKALKELHAEGVTILDDADGRPRPLNPVENPAQTRSMANGFNSPLFANLEEMFELEDIRDSDPYNHNK